MKKLFLLLAVVGLMFSACTEGGGIEDDNGTTEQPGGSGNNGSDDGEKPEELFFELDKEEITISPNGGSAEVVVYSNCEWEISGTSDWCTPSVVSGEANEDGQKVTFSADVAYDDREAIFQFCCAEEKIQLVVKQSLKEAIIADENNTFTVPAEGGAIEIAYQTNVECEVIIPSEAKSWISIAPKTKGLVSEKANLTVAENKTYDARSAVIKVVKKGNSTLYAEYTVNQKQKDAIIADKNNTFEVPAKGGNISLTYKTNVECKVVIPDEAKEWVSLVPKTKGLSIESSTLTVAENTTYGARSAVIKVVAADNEELMAEYTINQKQNDAILADGNTAFEVPAEGGTVEIAYQTNVECEVVIPDEAKEWISIAPKTKGLVSEKANLIVAENTTYDARSAVIKVVKKGNSTLYAEYTVNQKQKDAIIADENTTFEVPAEGGTVEIAYQTNVECKVVIPDEAKEWISIAPKTKGLVSEKANLTVAENTTYEARSAVIKVVAADNEELMAEYTINQKQNDAILADGNTTFEVPAEGDTVDIAYQTNVECEVVIPDEAKEWISIAPKTKGLVSEKTTLIVAANITEEARSVVIKVVAAGNEKLMAEYTINQAHGYILKYTSSNGEIVTPYKSDAFGATILVNEYKDGVGYLVFDAHVTSIGEQAFRNCSSLTSITIPDSVTKIGSYAFRDCSSLTSVTIPDSVTGIGDGAFYGCRSLTSVTIPDSVTSIGADYTFKDCEALKSINIPEGTTKFGSFMFGGCFSLETITIPASLTELGFASIYQCRNLKYVYCKAATPPSPDENFFRGCSSIEKIYVPHGSVEAYKTADGWKDFAAKIEGYDF